MREAIKTANSNIIQHKYNEVPVGCVIVCDGIEMARANNQMEALRNPIAHAEILAIQQALKYIKKNAYDQQQSKYLEECTLYCTLEPCTMCEAAINLARIKKVIFGAYATSQHTTHPNTIGGVLEEECKIMVKLR